MIRCSVYVLHNECHSLLLSWPPQTNIQSLRLKCWQPKSKHEPGQHNAKEKNPKGRRLKTSHTGKPQRWEF